MFLGVIYTFQNSNLTSMCPPKRKRPPLRWSFLFLREKQDSNPTKCGADEHYLLLLRFSIASSNSLCARDQRRSTTITLLYCLHSSHSSFPRESTYLHLELFSWLILFQQSKQNSPIFITSVVIITNTHCKRNAYF